MDFFKQKDVRLFLVLVPAFTMINYWITYSNIAYNTGFLKAFGIDLFSGYMCWLAIRFIIRKVEKQHTRVAFSKLRFAKLLFFTFTAAIVVTILLPSGHQYMTGKRYATTISEIFIHDLAIFLIWILGVNFIYILMRYYEVWKKSEERLEGERTLKTEGLNIRIGDKNVKFQIDAILGFYVEDGCTFLINPEFKTFIVDSSLDKLEQIVPERYFFRVNRKFLLHRKAILSFKRIEDSKLHILTLAEKPFPDGLKMSRLKAPAFKKWFEQDTAVL